MRGFLAVLNGASTLMLDVAHGSPQFTVLPHWIRRHSSARVLRGHCQRPVLFQTDVTWALSTGVYAIELF